MGNVGRGLALLMICALTACGDSGHDDDDGAGGAFDRLEQQSDALRNEVQDLAYTEPSSLPTTGTATYDGVVTLDIEAIPNATLQGADMAGNLDLTVNFAAAGGAITGQADEFVGVDGEEFQGGLIIDNGSIDRGVDEAAEYTYGANMAGELTGEDGTNWTLDADLLGDFAGSEHSHAFGDVRGTSCTAAGCSGVAGDFVAER